METPEQELEQGAVRAVQSLLGYWDEVYFRGVASAPTPSITEKYLYHVQVCRANVKEQSVGLCVTWASPGRQAPVTATIARMFVDYSASAARRSTEGEGEPAFEILRHVPGGRPLPRDPRAPSDDGDWNASTDEAESAGLGGAAADAASAENGGFSLTYRWEHHALRHVVTQTQLEELQRHLELHGSGSELSADAQALVQRRFMLANPVARVHELARARQTQRV